MPENKTGNNNHQHGGSPYKDFIRLGITPRPVIDFSVNINPLGPPRQVTEAWQDLSNVITSYPSIDGAGVRRFYKDRFDIPSEFVLPGNGSIELIYLVPRALGLKKVLIFFPCFHDYDRAARLAGAELVSFPFDTESDFGTLSLEILEEKLKNVDALCIGNPNNPTGTVFSRDDLLHLSKKYPDKWFLVDEAFVQFLENAEQTSLLHPGYLHRNILVFHSLTKFYALPGLRLGAVIGHPKTISRLADVKEPWTVNGIAENVAGILANCRGYEKKSLGIIHSERKRIYQQVMKIPSLRIVSATTNFFLAQWRGTESVDDLLRNLLSKGLYIRDCRNFPGLENNFFRFGLRMPEDNDLLMLAMAGPFGGGNG